MSVSTNWSKVQISLLGLMLAFSSCQDAGTLFVSLPPEQTGIDFKNVLVEDDDFNILDYLYFYNGGGVAVGDINNDGLPDIYFSANQSGNKLYLNKGNLQFEDITDGAGVAGKSDWNTGAVMGDINGDGWMDIYVCAVVGIRGQNGHNELFVNNGDNTFTEKSAEYGLDFDTFSSSAAFLDYDLDGDLDMFLLNHAVHTQESFGHADLRYKRTYSTGDRLLRNQGGKFEDVSEESGILGGVNGYGLGVAVADFNQDGWADIYVGNDFHEDDYYYLNQGDGTFKESLRSYFGHTSRFTMGCDAADINHDGLPDLMSLDMLPEDETVLKRSEGDDNIDVQRLRTERFGYHYQFTRNMLQVNQGKTAFMETALLSGVAATDWSWSVLIEDYNQDGEQDLLISNGIPRRPNDLDYIKFVSNDQIKGTIDATKLVDQKALELMPSGAAVNYFFKGQGDLSFEDASPSSLPNEALYSTSMANADLDRDGDLDVVINNVNSNASIYINQTNNASSYLNIRFKYHEPNTLGIGTKAYAYLDGKVQFKELYAVRGFQSSSEPMLHFGFGERLILDSLCIVWPNRTVEWHYGVPLNQALEISPKDEVAAQPVEVEVNRLFQRVEDNLGINFTHEEDRYTDFHRQKLIPYQVCDRGPATAIGDLNSDGKEDIFFGGSKYFPSQVFIQTDQGFEISNFPAVRKDSVNEEVDAAILDIDQDGWNDLLIANGGGDFYNKMEPLKDCLYLGAANGFTKSSIPEHFENASCVRPADYDADGDLDVFIGNQSITNDYGSDATSLLLRNDAGQLKKTAINSLSKTGMVTDACWIDYDANGTLDLIVVGEWMSPIFFKNRDGKLIKDEQQVSELNGLWQSLIPFDIDQDGDLDIVLGNWGLNNKFSASLDRPMKMFHADFDKNGDTETVIAVYKKDGYYPLVSFDELSSQLVFLKKKFNSYKDFAGKTVEEVFGGENLRSAKQLSVNTLHSGYLLNTNGSYSFVPFELKMQVAPITALLAHDFDKDGKDELLLGGNYFGVTPFHGRMGSFPGALISDLGDISYGHTVGLDFMGKSIRHLKSFSIKDKDYLLVTINNSNAQIYQF